MNGIERSIDKLGRIVLPISFREQLNLNTDDKIIISLENNRIILSPPKSICVICGASIHSSSEMRICKDCIEMVKKKY